MAKNRNYSYSDVNMIMASKIIAANFKAGLSELSTLRTNWTNEYADDLAGRIDQAIENYLGLDAKKELRKASRQLFNIMKQTIQSLAAFKIQIDDDFKDNPPEREEILKNLGFENNLKAVQRKDQEALIELLYAFKTNMTDALKREITSRGMNPDLIDNISGYAGAVKEANVTQESLKGKTRKITHEAAEVFIAIYSEIIGIYKIASKYYQNHPVKKEQFTFSKIVANLHVSGKVVLQD